MNYLDVLPDELLIYHIFPELPVTDIYKMSNVSDKLKSISLDKRMWNIKALNEKLVSIYFYNQFVGMVDYIDAPGFRTSSMLHILEHMKYYGYEDMRVIVPIHKPIREAIVEHIDDYEWSLSYSLEQSGISKDIINNIFLIYDKSRRFIHYVYKSPFIIKHINILTRLDPVESYYDLRDLYAIPINNRIFLYDKRGNLVLHKGREKYNQPLKIDLPDIPRDRYI